MKKRFAVLFLLLVLCPFALAQEEPPGDPPEEPPPGPQADLSVLKSGPAEAAIDSDVMYTVLVQNIGPDEAVGVTLTDLIPAGMDFVSSTPAPGFTCTPDQQNPFVLCSGANIPAGGTATFTFVFHISNEAQEGDTFVNFASADAETNDPNEENNGSSVITTIPSTVSDVGVTKNGPGSSGPDTDVTWTIVVSSLGPAAAMNVTLNDTIPGTMTFVSLTQNGSFSCTMPAVGAGGAISCTAATMAAGTSTTFLLTAHIPGDTPSGTEFTNTAVVSADSNVNEENDTASTTVIVSAADVAVVKSGPATATAGDDVPYTITVTNNGPDTALDVVLTDTVPPGTTFVSMTNVSGVVASPCGHVSGVVSCTFAVLGPGQTSTYTLVLRAGDTTSINNTANVTSSTFDDDPSNDSSTATTTVTPSADVAVTKNGPASATAGTNITYTVNVINNGPSTAANVSLVDTLPANTTLVSVLQSGQPFLCTPGVGNVTCTRATLAPATGTTFSITVAIAPTASGTITNGATVSTTTADPAGGNNNASAPTNVSSSADLAVTKTGTASAPAGTNVTYTVTVTNLGPSTAANVSLVDTFPAGVTYVTSSQTGGPTFACVPTATTLTCTRATLDPAAPATFDITFSVPVSAPVGTITNSATVSSTTPDPVPGNNTATALTGIGIAPADVSVTKTANAPALIAGTSAVFTILVSNAGPGVAENVVVTDLLPAGTTLISAPGCTGTTTVTCNAGTLAAGTSTTFTLTVNLPSTPGPVTNTATATSTTPDPTPNNNAGTVTIQAVAQAPGIPTLSEWGLLLLALALGAIVFVRTGGAG